MPLRQRTWRLTIQCTRAAKSGVFKWTISRRRRVIGDVIWLKDGCSTIYRSDWRRLFHRNSDEPKYLSMHAPQRRRRFSTRFENSGPQLPHRFVRMALPMLKLLEGGIDYFRPWYWRKKPGQTGTRKIILKVPDFDRLNTALEALEPLRSGERRSLTVDLKQPEFDSSSDAKSKCTFRRIQRCEKQSRNIGSTNGRQPWRRATHRRRANMLDDGQDSVVIDDRDWGRRPF